MSEVNYDIDALAAAAAEQDDFTEVESGNDRVVPTEGPCFVRLREYIEMGKQAPPKWKVEKYGKKDAKPRARWVFEITAAVRKHPETGERYNAANVTFENDGKSVSFNETIVVTTDISKNGKSGHQNLFSALNAAYGVKFKHPAQLLGCDGWKARILHKFAFDDVDENGNLKNPDAKPIGIKLRGSQGWTFEAPVKEDPETGDTTRIKVPELLEGPGSRKLFLWSAPSIEQWDDIHIAGEKDEFKDGKATGKKVSKNWLQEAILGAKDFNGSPLELVLGVPAGDLPDTGSTAAPTTDTDPLADLD